MKKTKPSALHFPSPAETVANNQDLLTQILIRISARPLLKLKLVSKQWLSLISSRQFAHLHQKQNHAFLTPVGLFLGTSNFCEEPFELPVVSLNSQIKLPTLNFIDDPQLELEVVQSCNGLLLLAPVCFRAINRSESYFVCNPMTRSFKRLSLTPIQKSSYLSGVNLAFDPVKSPYYYIVCVRQLLPPSGRFCVDIYSSKSDEWDGSCSSFEADKYRMFEYGVFCNGIIHWDGYRYARKPLMFDLENRVLKEMPMVPCMFGASSEDQKDEDSRFFGESRGILHMGITYRDSFEFNVFEMATDYSHWFHKYRLSLKNALENFPQLGPPDTTNRYFRFRILSVIRLENKVLRIVVLACSRVICYELKDGILANLYELNQCPETLYQSAIVHGVQGMMQVYNYFETLCDPNPMEEHLPNAQLLEARRDN